MNIDLFTNPTLNSVAVVPLILALVQVAKMMNVPHKWSPILSIGIGILLSFLIGYENGSLTNNILTGIIHGLSASGLYSGTKSMAHSESRTEP
jgi:hypothetical protein